MIEVFTITIERQGKRREYEMRTMDPKLDPRSRDDQYAEGFVANVLLSGQEICRTSAWDTREEAVSEAVHYLLTERGEGMTSRNDDCPKLGDDVVTIAEALERNYPVLDPLGNRIHHPGEPQYEVWREEHRRKANP